MKGDNSCMWQINSDFKEESLSTDKLVKSISSSYMTIPYRIIELLIDTENSKIYLACHYERSR